MESPQISKFENKISPIILPIIVILAAIFFISGLLHILIRHLLNQRQQSIEEDESDQSRNATAFQGRLHQLFHLHDSGVDQSSIDRLPVFLYRAVVGPDLKDPFDCAVCLGEFQPDHKLRLIPACSHAFHVDCIDTWLLTHSTCPLCRGSLLPSTGTSDRHSFSSLSDINNTTDNTIVCDENSHSLEDKVVQVKLGKFRSNAGVGSALEGGGDRKLDRRRCFSLGSYEYVMNETALLRVAVRPPPLPKSLEPRKKESFSVSKIWLRSKERNGNGESSRRALSFRLPPFRYDYDQFKGKSAEVGLGSEKEVDVEVGSCNDSVVSVDQSQISQTPSFARRTLMWVVSRQNRVGSHL